MPQGRGMVEGTLLPDGKVLWLNGANRGAQGFLLAENPTLRALLYDPEKAKGQRWTQLAQSSIPRLYHSVALLLLDGTVLVAGSNPNEMPVLSPKPGAPYITEFRVERFTPPYLQGTKASLRPTNVQVPATLTADGSTYTISFGVPASTKSVKIVLYHGGFVTHSVHMGHRMLYLDNTGWKAGQTKQTLNFKTPPNRNLAPPGPYVVYVVVCAYLINRCKTQKYEANDFIRQTESLLLENSSRLLNDLTSYLIYLLKFICCSFRSALS